MELNNDSIKPTGAVEVEGCLKMREAPVGGRLSLFAGNWSTQFYRQMLGEGIKVRWLQHLPPADFDKGEFKPASELEAKLVQEELSSLLKKEAVEVADSEGGHIYRWFLVSKKGTTDKRPVLNMKPGNIYVKYVHFKLEDLKTTKDLAQRGDWAVRIDLKDAYLHVPVAKTDRRFFRFRHRGKVYQWKCLAFGYRDAPRLFQKMMIEALRELREQGVRIVIYLDDILVLANSRDLCLEHRDLVVHRLLFLGFIINLEKSILEPTQRIHFLGVILDLLKMMFELPQDKLTCYRRRIKKLIKKAKRSKPFTLLELQSIVGTLVSVNDCIWASRIHINSLIELLRKALEHKDGQVIPSAQAAEDLQWWMDNLEIWNGKALHMGPVDEILEVDSSDSGFGAVRKHPGGDLEVTHKILDLEDKRHNNVKELLAAEFGLIHFTNKWQWTQKSILIKTDNMTAMSYINRMGGKVANLTRISERLHSFAIERKLTVRAEWIAGEDNIEADRASRIQEDYKESQLNPEIFKLVHHWAGPLEVDLFASLENAQLPKFVTLKAHPKSYYFDALAHPLPAKAYANPPFILIPRVLQKVRMEQAELVLIAPLWTTQPWWATLVDLVVEPPLLLPRINNLFRVGQENRLPKWETLAWKLSGRRSRHAGFPPPLSSYCFISTRSGQIKKQEASIITKAYGKHG